ncbi:hypothetical protein V6N12_014796 [Hibiscus sabdariffa]|uniref:Uncharacterized protein n=1 Tax=Hibiscus sabdariffa TaxID=183260 RepID=A0ABR2DL91_9ROSI
MMMMMMTGKMRNLEMHYVGLAERIMELMNSGFYVSMERVSTLHQLGQNTLNSSTNAHRAEYCLDDVLSLVCNALL